MQKVNPSKYVGDYPPTVEARQAFLGRFKPRIELQIEWLVRTPGAISQILQDAFDILPSVLWLIIFSYTIQ
jgi:hypothetical protein